MSVGPEDQDNTERPVDAKDAITEPETPEEELPEAEEPREDVGPEVSAGPTEEAAPRTGELDAIQEQYECVMSRLDELAEGIEQLSRQQEYLPPQIRQLGTRVDDVADSLGAPRVRDLLKSLLMLYHLLDQMLRDPAGDADTHHRNYTVLLDQIRQMLESNGFFLIDTEGPFDPEVHRAMEIEPCQSPEEAGRISRVLRPGFRSERSVLRPAEVTLTRYDGPAEAEECPEPAAADEGDSEGDDEGSAGIVLKENVLCGPVAAGSFGAGQRIAREILGTWQTGRR